MKKTRSIDRAKFLASMLFCAFAFIEQTFADGPPSMAVRVKDECLVSGGRVAFSGLFEINYTKPNDLKTSVVYQLNCELKSKECTGAKLDLTSGVISFLTLSALENAMLLSVKGSTFIVEWGRLRTFVVDIENKKVSYRESGKSLLTGQIVEGSATLSCK